MLRVSQREVTRKLVPAAFTLVELLVVIAIIGVLVALLLPAVQSAREAARRNTCKNNLKQWALGALTHESNLKHYPSGGWGNEWIGDADRGSGMNQPGGWIYNTLPFIEQQALHDLPRDGKPDVVDKAQLQGALQMLQNPLSIVNCPTRRHGIFPHGGSAGARNADLVSNVTAQFVGRGDYAANAGDSPGGVDTAGPNSMRVILTTDFEWDCINRLGLKKDGSELTGISFQRSEVGIRHITDGTTHTYLCGERFLNADHYDTGKASADNETWCTGANNDNYRLAYRLPRMDHRGQGPEASERPDREGGDLFGSAHSAGWHVAYCDGHVEGVGYDIDLQVHRNKGNRGDGQTAP